MCAGTPILLLYAPSHVLVFPRCFVLNTMSGPVMWCDDAIIVLCQVHVSDLANAYELVTEAPRSLVAGLLRSLLCIFL